MTISSPTFRDSTNIAISLSFHFLFAALQKMKSRIREDASIGPFFRIDSSFTLSFPGANGVWLTFLEGFQHLVFRNKNTLALRLVLELHERVVSEKSIGTLGVHLLRKT
jgi:hypothetical protein